MIAAAKTVPTAASDDPGPEKEEVLELEAVCRTLDRWPESFSDEDFWLVAGRSFIGIVLRTDVLDGDALWKQLTAEFERERKTLRRRLTQLNATHTLGLYTFTKETLLARILEHLIAYANWKRSELH